MTMLANVVSVHLLRTQYVLPNLTLEHYATRKLIAIEIRPEAHGLPWWRAEQHILLRFAGTKPMSGAEFRDDRAEAAKTCTSCGKCCTRLPDHQIAIYMSRHERVRAEFAGFKIFNGIAGKIQLSGPQLDGKRSGVFDVLKTKDNGDCHFLGPEGCTLGDYKPLWCKMYYCEKLYGGSYPFETLVPLPALPSETRLTVTPPEIPVG